MFLKLFSISAFGHYYVSVCMFPLWIFDVLILVRYCPICTLTSFYYNYSSSNYVPSSVIETFNIDFWTVSVIEIDSVYRTIEQFYCYVGVLKSFVARVGFQQSVNLCKNRVDQSFRNVSRNEWKKKDHEIYFALSKQLDKIGHKRER